MSTDGVRLRICEFVPWWWWFGFSSLVCQFYPVLSFCANITVLICLWFIASWNGPASMSKKNIFRDWKINIYYYRKIKEGGSVLYWVLQKIRIR